jgi:tetratricopeptide (TPR) repeat protein
MATQTCPLRPAARPPGWWVACALLAGMLAALAAPAPAQALENATLLQQLAQGNAQDRRNALLRLADQGDFATVPWVAAALSDEDGVARKLAEQALWAIWSRSGDEEVDALLRQGTHLLNRGQPGASVAVFTQIIERAPDFAEGWNKRATAYYHIGQYEKSLLDIDETLKRNPFHFGALSGAGLCLVELGRDAEALAYFDRALAINPNLAGILELKEQVARRARRPLV